MKADPISPTSYFVIVSPSYGGAEKRFFDIFCAMRQMGWDIGVVMPSELAAALLKDNDIDGETRAAVVSLPMPNWSRLGFVRQMHGWLRSQPRRLSFHYPMNCLWPLHVLRGDRVTLSAVYCIEPPGPRASLPTLVWTWLSFFFVRHIDVLSPAILASLSGTRSFGKMSLTPGGTFVDAANYHVRPKQPKVALLSRLVELKGVDDLLDVLPDTWALLRGRVPLDFTFSIAGYGPLEKHVRQRVAELNKSGVPIDFAGYARASDYLQDVAIGLSMQEATNYPSRVVAEGLLSGCSVIVRDTGDSRQFGDVKGIAYCSGSLDAAELAALILDGLSKSSSQAYPETIREAAMSKFSSATAAKYFADVTQSLTLDRQTSPAAALQQ